MALRIRKSFKVAPGVRVNVGKKSGSVSIGGRGFRVTKSTTGRTTTSAGIPGTGVGWTSSKSAGRKGRAPTPALMQQSATPTPRGKSRLPVWLTVIAVIVLLAIIF